MSNEVPCPWKECDWRLPDGKCWMGTCYPLEWQVKDAPCVNFRIRNPCWRCKRCVDYYCIKKDFYPNANVCADECQYAQLVPLKRSKK